MRSRLPPAEPIASTGLVTVERQRGRHHALHPRAGLEVPDEQVALAHHAVQVQVEAGQEVARAEAQARGEDDGVPLRVDRDEVGRVRLRLVDVRREGVGEPDDALCRRRRPQRADPPHGRRHPGEAAARQRVDGRRARARPAQSSAPGRRPGRRRVTAPPRSSHELEQRTRRASPSTPRPGPRRRASRAPARGPAGAAGRPPGAAARRARRSPRRRPAS